MRASGLKVPGPAPLPIVDGWISLARFSRDPLAFADRVFARFGPVASLVFGRSTHVVSTEAYSPGTVLVQGAELNRQVVSQHEEFHKTGLAGPLYPHGELTHRTRPLSRMLTGLFHVNGEEHRAQRRLLMPAFHKKRIESYRDDMVAITESVISSFRHGQLRDIRADTTELTLRIATKTLFGEDAGGAGTEIGRELQQWLKLLGPSVALPIDLPLSPYARWLDLTRSIDEKMRAIIEQKRRRGQGGDDILATLLETRDEQGAPLGEDELVGHTGVIFAAGHETSSNALCWTLFLLSQHPRVMADLFDELSGELRGEAPSVEQLGKLPLLDRVLKESLRLFPPAPFNHRIAARDLELYGYALPRGTELLVSIYHTQRDAAVFTQPNRFLPERWERLDPGPYAYSPFSAGPRMCIGAAFALMELKIVLAIVLQRFRFELDPDRRLDRFLSITMAPKSGMWMTLHPPRTRLEARPRRVRGNVGQMIELFA